MTKNHFQAPQSEQPRAACGRDARPFRITDNTHRVDCLNCRRQPEFVAAVEVVKAKVEVEFAAQTPSQVRKMWGDPGFYECYKCGGDLFRERPRSLFSFHFVCEGCGTSMHPPTETGMCT